MNQEIKEQAKEEFDKSFTHGSHIDLYGKYHKEQIRKIHGEIGVINNIHTFLDSLIDKTVQMTEEKNKISFLKFISSLPTFQNFHFELNGTPYCDHGEKLRGKQEGEMVDLINRYSLYRFLIGKNTGHVEKYSAQDLLRDVESLITNKSDINN